LALTLCACDPRDAPSPRWFIVKQEVAATEDGSIRLRRGFGVEVVESRRDAIRTGEGHWFPRSAFEPASPSAGSVAAAPDARPPARPAEVGTSERWIEVDIVRQVLTAYAGDAPVRAMRISSGVGEEGAFYSTP